MKMTNMKRYVCHILLLTIAATSSLVTGEKCGYDRGPLASTDDTVVIKLDCNHSLPSSHSVPLQLPGNVTHLAVQLAHCHAVPVGLFTDVSNNLTSVTAASEDSILLLGGTFVGLGQITELRLFNFTKLRTLSESLLEPLRNIETLILDGFGSAFVMLPKLGSVIRKLSGTPIRRLVLNEIRTHVFLQHFMQVDNFKISNASVKELIITDSTLNYVGSIRQAFPELVCFCGRGTDNGQMAASVTAVWDLMLSDKLEELVIHQPKVKESSVAQFPFALFVPSILNTLNNFPDLLKFISTQTANSLLYCALGFAFEVGANLSKITISGFPFPTITGQSFCFQENNNIIYFDLSGSHVLSSIPFFTGLVKLKYLSIENTGVENFPNTFLEYLPSLEVLKLGKNDIGDFIENADEDFFGSCPTLTDIHLDECNMTNIPRTIFSRSFNIERIDLSKNYIRTVDLYLENCTRLNVLNFSSNIIKTVSREDAMQLSQLALQKPQGRLVVDFGQNNLHCLCNSTHFIRWLQRLPAHSNLKFMGFDSYRCLYPNGSIVFASKVIVKELEQQCSLIKTLVNGSNCPCDEDLRTRIGEVWVHLDGFFCRNEDGNLVSMKNRPLPSCFIPYLRASFIVPVVLGGILGISVLISVGLLIYYRKSERVRQMRECLQINPAHFVRMALQYVMTQNREEEQTQFQYDMIVFTQNEDRSSIHTHFLAALRGIRTFITRDDFLPGAAEVDAMVESIRVCRWIVPVLTANFLSDPVCVDFISRVQFRRPHALIPVVWQQPLDVADDAVAELFKTSEPFYWPGDAATPEEQQQFWSALFERTLPL